MSNYGKTDIEQAIANHRKVARSLIRLKHSVAADIELNDVMPVIERKLQALAASGQVPSLTTDELLSLTEGTE